MKTAIEYSTVRDSLNTCDIVLWSGTGRLSRFIKRGCFSTWSHVGMVVRIPGDFLMLWESTVDTDVNGVYLSPLSKSIYGSVAVRKLILPDSVDINNLHDKLMTVRKDLEGRQFEKNLSEFILAGYDGPFGENTRDVSTLFCSELIAETLQRIGLLDCSKPSNEFTPKDFSTESSEPLPLLLGAAYSDEIYLMPDVKPQKTGKEISSTLFYPHKYI